MLDDVNMSIEAEFIHVETGGTFLGGSSDCRLTSDITITLTVGAGSLLSMKGA